MVRNFGSPNADPRAKRALAHARINSADGSDASLARAKEAVLAAGDSRKSRGSGFTGALAGLAMKDAPTKTIVEGGNTMLAECVDERGSIRVTTPDYLVGERGVIASRIAYRNDADEITRYSSFTVVAHGSDSGLMAGYPGTRLPIIPINEEAMQVDTLAVRELPVEARVIMATLVDRVVQQD